MQRIVQIGGREDFHREEEKLQMYNKTSYWRFDAE